MLRITALSTESHVKTASGNSVGAMYQSSLSIAIAPSKPERVIRRSSPSSTLVASETVKVFSAPGLEAVSYTHLRAHETEADL
eukprot:707169-Rhodomonas_salina.2